jgi:hypothetical protein
MSKEIAIRDITILVLGFLTILLLFKGCNDRKRSTSLVLDLQNYSDKVKEYEDANGNLIEYNAAMQLLVDQRSDEVLAMEKRLKLKDTEILIKYKSIFKHDTISHVFREQLPCTAFIDSFSVDSTFFKFDAIITEKNFKLYNVQIPNEQTFIIAKKKSSWLKEDSLSVIVENSNPNIKGESLRAFTFKPSPKWYNSYKFKGAVFVAGVIGGVMMAK